MTSEPLAEKSPPRDVTLSSAQMLQQSAQSLDSIETAEAKYNWIGWQQIPGNQTVTKTLNTWD